MCTTHYEGRLVVFDCLPEEVCDCRCHRFSDRPNCLHWAEPCCFHCNLCGQLIKRELYSQHYRRHLKVNQIKNWEALTIVVEMAMSRVRKR